MVQLTSWSDRSSPLGFGKVRTCPPCYRKMTIGNIQAPIATHYDGIGFTTSIKPIPGVHAAYCDGQAPCRHWSVQLSDLFDNRLYIYNGSYYYGFSETLFV